MVCKRQKQCELGKICTELREGTDLLGCSMYKPKKPKTNEEFIRFCTTEELADTLYRLCNHASIFGGSTKKEFELWLKEKHE